MARDLSITYVQGSTTTTIGGSSASNLPIERMETSWRSDGGQILSTFRIKFLLLASSYSDFKTKVTTIQDALTQQRGKLTVGFSGNNFEVFDPTIATLSGYDPDVTLDVDPQPTNTAYARRYIWTAIYKRPATQIGQAGRKFSGHEDLSYAIERRRIVTFTGDWTAIIGTDAPTQYASQIEAYCQAWITTYVSASATFEFVENRPVANDSNTEVSYTRIYWEHVNGRAGSRALLSYSPGRRKTVTFTGKYIVTGHSSGAGTAAKTNFDDPTTGELARETAGGGPLATYWPGVTFDLVGEPKVDFNEKNESLEFTVVRQQVLSIPGGIGSPTFWHDIKLTYGLVDASPGYSPDVLLGSGAPDAGAGGLSGPVAPGTTGSPDPVPATPGSGGGTASVDSDLPPPSGLTAHPLVEMAVHYECWIDVDLAGDNQARALWKSTIRQYVINQITAQSGFKPSAINPEKVVADTAENRLTVDFTAWGIVTTLLRAEQDAELQDDNGLRFTGILNGKLGWWLIQQGLARRLKTRTLAVAYIDGTYKKQQFYLDKHPAPGGGNWIRCQPRVVKTGRRRVGVLGNQLTVYTLAISETFLYVLQAVGASFGSGAPPATGGGSGGGSGPAALGVTDTGAGKPSIFSSPGAGVSVVIGAPP